MKRSEIVKRAKFALQNSKALYKLGTGGYRPEQPLPESANGLCDCSGFVSWCLGERRQTANKFLVSVNGGWIETTAVVKDANSPDGMFTKVTTPKAGDVIVYGDANGHQGHIGIISEVVDGKVTKVIHCNARTSRENGKAIAETGPDGFLRSGAIFARFDKVEED